MDPTRQFVILLVGLTFAAAMPACNDNPAPVVNTVTIPPVSEVNRTDAQRLSNGASKLIDGMKSPSSSFHFSYTGRENLNVDKAKPPQVGPVVLQADISPEEISVVQTRGGVLRTAKAKYGDEINWGMANLMTLGVMTHPTLVIAMGASVTSPPVSDMVGTTLADKFTFDTSSATDSQKIGLEQARMVVSTIKDCRGTAWIANDSGLLVKFNIDADYVDKNNHSWQEHYEGEVTPK
jgi:hypothetical protein